MLVDVLQSTLGRFLLRSRKSDSGKGRANRGGSEKELEDGVAHVRRCLTVSHVL